MNSDEINSVAISFFSCFLFHQEVFSSKNYRAFGFKLPDKKLVSLCRITICQLECTYSIKTVASLVQSRTRTIVFLKIARLPTFVVLVQTRTTETRTTQSFQNARLPRLESFYNYWYMYRFMYTLYSNESKGKILAVGLDLLIFYDQP